MHSFSHRCCSHHQYNFMNECCYWDVNGSPGTPKPKDSEFCPATSGIQDKKNAAQPHCTEPKTHLCGSHCYDPNKHRCCERKRASGQHDAALYDPDTHVCCDGHVKPGMGQCCGETQPGVFCCNKDREDGEECSDTSIPYNPAKGTICSSQFHGSPGQHCCGTEIYQPGNEICCDGHRYPKEGNVQCCGIKAYNMKDPKMKCCAGTLYNLTDPEYSRDVECCGSVLRNPQEQEVCCSSMDQAVLYSGKTGFSCCGHLYFNMSLWSCSAECLSPVQQPGQQEEKMTGCRLESVNNLNETALCGEIYIGIVQSVSPNSIVFNFVLKINGTNADVRPVPFHYVLATPSRCSTPKLILGKFYFFNDVSVFADFNHDTALQSLYFILDKCSP
ncbi:galaxin [Acanthochromis polyacanthus]|uniref:galaxin n=1 Tax=Acanthochromis polyacanthus TaxID=80966 RepID=UPI00223401E7|nr:galaxin [Acanthochromis polyacanthus]